MSIMGVGDFTVWSDPETMTTTVIVDGHTEQVTQTVGEMLEILGRYMTRLQDENAKLRELVREMHATISRNNSWWDFTHEDTRRFAYRMHELEIEVEP